MMFVCVLLMFCKFYGVRRQKQRAKLGMNLAEALDIRL